MRPTNPPCGRVCSSALNRRARPPGALPCVGVCIGGPSGSSTVHQVAVARQSSPVRFCGKFVCWRLAACAMSRVKSPAPPVSGISLAAWRFASRACASAWCFPLLQRSLTSTPHPHHPFAAALVAKCTAVHPRNAHLVESFNYICLRYCVVLTSIARLATHAFPVLLREGRFWGTLLFSFAISSAPPSQKRGAPPQNGRAGCRVVCPRSLRAIGACPLGSAIRRGTGLPPLSLRSAQR